MPTILIILPLMLSMVTFFVRFYRLNPEENVRNPNFLIAALCLLLMLSYLLGVQIYMGGSALASFVYFMVAMLISVAAIRALFRMRGRV